MTIALKDLFDSDDPALGPRGSRQWNRKVFSLAYCSAARQGKPAGPDGPFLKVCERLERGFSVLAYLPGDCMAAAAEHVSETVGAAKWVQFGRPSPQARTYSAVLAESTDILDSIAAWIAGGTSDPRAIFHNLDILGDGHGGVYQSEDVKTALLHLTDGIRSGVVLGLADRDAGELPGPVRRLFPEEIWLDEVPTATFARLIPRRLGECLKDARGEVPDEAAWLLASRLRWTDPIRAVRIMDGVARLGAVGRPPSKASPLRVALNAILERTQSVEFKRPDEIEAVDIDPGTGKPTGFEPDTVDLLRTSVIEPFDQWARFTGSVERCRIRLNSLPPGLILHGPPGTGKTRLARWIAKSIGLPIRQVSAADLKRADWGLTEQLVRDLFRSARRSAPCVIVLDDADDLVPDRGGIQGSLASAERGIVNAFLQELEGFGGRLEGVLLILTTNRFAELDLAARERLHIHMPIPYPLDHMQVGEVVDSAARSYGICPLQGDVRAELVRYFMGPVSPSNPATALVNIGLSDERRKLEENLFSPRAIAAAMRLLLRENGASPSLAEVEKMKAHLKRQSDVVEAATRRRGGR